MVDLDTDNPQTIRLNPADLRKAGQSLKLKFPGPSILGVLSKLEEGESSSSGALFEEAEHALVFLAESRRRIGIKMMTVAGVELHECFVDDVAALVSVLGNSGCEITFPVTSQKVTEKIAEIFSPHTASKFPVSDDLSGAALLALAAVVDELRMLYAASLIHRSQVPSLFISLNSLEEHISSDRLGDSDYRWIVKLIFAGYSQSLTFSSQVLEQGIRELEEREWLSSTEVDGSRQILPSQGMVDLAYDLLSPLPACILETGKEGALLSFRGSSLWTVQPSGESFEFSSVDGLSWFEKIYNTF